MTLIAQPRREAAPWPPQRPARPARRAGLLRELFGAIIMLAGLAGCGSLVYGLLQVGGTDDARPGPPAAPEQPWAEIRQPIQLYALQSLEFGREPRRYEARRHRSGGGRQDVLTYGAEFGEGPYLRLSLYRIGSEPVRTASFFVDLARQAAQAGLAVARSAQPVSLPTKFGPLESADVLLERGVATAACVAFRLAAGDPGLRMDGLACGTSSAPDRASLACVLDRLDLVSGSGDPPLLAFFTEAEQRRGQTCQPRTAARAPGGDPIRHSARARNGGQLARIQP